MGKSFRQSGIELLRILTACAVVMLHYNDGRAFTYVTSGGANEIALYLLESLCICAVDLFVLICGYFSCTTQKRSLMKPFELYFESVFIHYGIYIVKTIVKYVFMGTEGFSIESFLLESISSYLILASYFVVLYIVLYFLSPYINVMLNHLDSQQWRKLLLTLLLLFSVYAVCVDLYNEILDTERMGMSPITAWGNKQGFNIVNFVLMYIIGAYIRRQSPFKKVKSRFLVLAIVGNTLIISLWAFVNTLLSKHGLRSAWVYHNPLVILQAVLFFILFSRLTFQSTIVNNLAKASFTCFLFHGYILGLIKIEWAVEQPLPIMLVHICVCICIIYLLSWVVYQIYRLCTGWLFDIIKRHKLFQPCTIG